MFFHFLFVILGMKPFSFPQETGFYKGKVRDVYYIGKDLLVMIASNRISAFDVILPRPIPYKGQVLNRIASFMLQETRDICPNWLLGTPTAQSSVGKKCDPFKIEMIVRGNLTGHAWRTYETGERILCGEKLPDHLKRNDYFPVPIITPTTKAAEGHDEDISADEIIKRGIVTVADWDLLRDYALRLFERGRELAKKRGLILADTKYEFGKIGDQVYLMDEIHTPDSSRYFYADDFEQKLRLGKEPLQLSKEFVREWLIAEGFMGQSGQTVPLMDDERVDAISKRYIELYEKVTGLTFEKEDIADDQTYQAICRFLETVN